MNGVRDAHDLGVMSHGTRVQVSNNHGKSGKSGIIISVVRNRSGRPENQWYDVRFDDGSYGRFHTRNLMRIT